MVAAFSPAFRFDEEEGLDVGGQFLDGRAATLEDQAKGPFLNPLERANTATQQVADKVRGADYATLFKQVYGQDIFVYSDAVYDSIAGAIAAVDRTRAFNNFTSKYDAYLAGKAQHGKHLSTKDWRASSVSPRRTASSRCRRCTTSP